MKTVVMERPEQGAEAVQSATIVSNCTSLNLKRAARAASNILDDYLQPIGLRASQFGMLSAISRAGSTTMTHLAEALVSDRTTVTRNLQLLQRDSLVQIAAGTDRRVREITLTEQGYAMLTSARPYWQQAEDSLKEKLGADRLETLLSLARSMAALADETTKS